MGGLTAKTFEIQIQDDPSGTDRAESALIRYLGSSRWESIRQVDQRIDLTPRKGFGRAAHAAVHGLTVSMSISSKSLTLRVATALSRERATAAIWQSAGGTLWLSWF